MWGKSPRTLHLEVSREDTRTTIELVATNKRLISKTDLAADTPDSTYSIGPKELGTLQYWLSVRYRHAAFADMFVDRMSDTGIDKKLAKKLDNYPIVSAVYFGVDNGREVDRRDETSYNLNIVLSFMLGDDPLLSLEVAEDEVEQLFSQKCYNNSSGTRSYFKLDSCIAISEDDITVTKARLLSPWRLEHVSLKASGDEAGPTAVQL